MASQKEGFLHLKKMTLLEMVLYAGFCHLLSICFLLVWSNLGILWGRRVYQMDRVNKKLSIRSFPLEISHEDGKVGYEHGIARRKCSKLEL